MAVLVACEESQAVTLAFRRLGVLAFSCDIKPCSGGHPEWHILGDAREFLRSPALRSKTSLALAAAMANQWAGYL